MEQVYGFKAAGMKYVWTLEPVRDTVGLPFHVCCHESHQLRELERFSFVCLAYYGIG